MNFLRNFTQLQFFAVQKFSTNKTTYHIGGCVKMSHNMIDYCVYIDTCQKRHSDTFAKTRYSGSKLSPQTLKRFLMFTSDVSLKL